MWILDMDGNFTEAQFSQNTVMLDPNENWKEVLTANPSGNYSILFAGFADGCGMSVAREVRRFESKTDTSDSSRLIATGHILPDQARMLFQVGFDAIAISDDMLKHHSREAWQNALSDSVLDLYSSLYSNSAQKGITSRASIWHKRSSPSAIDIRAA